MRLTLRRSQLFLAGLSILALAVFITIAQNSLGFWHWGDEDEKIVAAAMMAGGQHLYKDVFAHHGALNYALAHAVYVVTGSLDLAPYRLTQWLTVLLAGAALAASPLLREWPRRLAAGSLFCVQVALLAPLWYGHTLLYHALGGVATSIALSLLLLPLMFGAVPPRPHAALGGAALAAAPFAAYPFLVSAVMLLLAALMLWRAHDRQWGEARPPLRMAAFGFGLFTLLMLLWLLLFGDLVGYGIYHLWFNQAIYASFIDFAPGAALAQLEQLFQSPLGWVLWAVVLFILLVVVQTAAYVAGRPNRSRRVAWLAAGAGFLLVGILFLNPRGEVIFKNAALWVVGLGLLTLVLVWVPRGPHGGVAILPLKWLGLLVAIAAPLYLAGIKGWSDVDQRYTTRAYAERKAAAYAERVALVQTLLPHGEPILAMVFSPRWYLLTKRLPSSGAYYYLPWQAAYNRSPVLGYKLDPCADLTAAPPKLIVWDRWKVWDRYDVADYAPCLVEIMQRDYAAITGTQFLLRKPVSETDRVTVKQFGFELAPVESAE